MPKSVTNGNIYEFIDNVRLELKTDIRAIDRKVDVVQDKMTTFEIRQATTNATITTKVLVIGAIGVSIFSAILYAAMQKVIR